MSTVFVVFVLFMCFRHAPISSLNSILSARSLILARAHIPSLCFLSNLIDLIGSRFFFVASSTNSSRALPAGVVFRALLILSMNPPLGNV
jgi:hypothetical protein